MMDMGFGGAPALRELPRRWSYRVLIVLFLAPFAFFTFVGAAFYVVDAASRQDWTGLVVGGGLFALGGVLLLALTVWLFWREQTRTVKIYETGIEARMGSKTVALRWDEIEEIWLFAQRVQAGGLLGMAVTAAVDAMRKDTHQALNENTTNIVVRFKSGDGRQVKISNMDKGVVATFEEALRRVNPRLVQKYLDIISNGGEAVFGKIRLSRAGIAFGNKAPVPFHEVSSLAIDNGQIVVKKDGKWLSLGSAPVAATPNVYVLTALFTRLTDGSVKTDVAPGKNLAGKMYA